MNEAIADDADHLSYQDLLRRMSLTRGVQLEAFHTLSSLEDHARLTYEPKTLATRLWADEAGATGDLLELMGDHCPAEARRIFDHLGVRGDPAFCASKLCELAATPPPGHSTSSVSDGMKEAAGEVLRSSPWMREVCVAWGLAEDCAS